MPFSHHPTSEAADTKLSELPSVGGRYALRRCMAETALGKVYWACDQHQPQTQTHEADCNALIFTVLPALARNSVFEQALRQVLPAYRQTVASQPTVIDDGKEADGTRWLVLQNIRGMLLSERLQELDDRGMPLDEALDILDGISHATTVHPPHGIFGFLEPGAILGDGHQYCLLNAPVVAALRLASNSIINTQHNRQTFHSGFISPEVALGDQAESADDTFSLACIAYCLFQGHQAFGKHTTLEAAVRNTSPAVISKLKPEMWSALRQGLSLKREQRQANPPLLLQGLQQRARPRFLLPVVALSLVGLVAYAGYQIFSEPQPMSTAMVSSEATLPISAQTSIPEQPPQHQTPTLVNEPNISPDPDQETAQAESAPIAAENAANAAEETARIEAIHREAEARIASELAAATTANTVKTAEQQKQLDTWLKQAETAIRAGRLHSDDPTKPTAAHYLTQVLELDPENISAKTLALQMVDDQQREAETLIKARRYSASQEVLLSADKLISQFKLNDSLKRQVELEMQADPAFQNTNQATQYLQGAERAMGYGNLMKGDDRSEGAVDYLSTLFELHPNHPEGMKLLKRIIRQQHDMALGALQKRNTETARTHIDDSQKLIGRYTLEDMLESQLELEKRYRDSHLEGIFPSTNTTATPNNNKPVPPATAPIPPTPQPAASPVVTHEPATPVAATTSTASTPESTPSTPLADTSVPTDSLPPTDITSPATTDAPAATPFTEVTVPPDSPIATTPAIPETLEMPSVLLEQPQNDAQARSPQPLPDPTTMIEPAPEVMPPPPAAAPKEFEIPLDVGNTNSSFTPDVDGLREIPTEVLLPDNDN
ncbi:serine/threonine-protein kinase [Candidatus Thiothrix anitrata]|uniref:Protein kinase domain-containing protein n=1 Tax=Candidatus Thiothrix anitrata TaxID=2823902 RepID=A0ABX7WZI1_9GAMM|nr:hypothetical protein [Candidatus Thiothrix anitrata]QTR49119.1 hypothetical protein J8380_12690 [Candidatus Thiothrix anitrata]